ncbi:hypothetical protein F4775DRAFT_571343 [Biscogniauxia sp. FL1348]|nr:hypothetical protein F4775DRAFT_571343 [Biscogniauxia sp. FL1348]
MAEGKIQTTTVPISTRPEVAQCLHTIIIFSVLITLWTGLRWYARRMKRMPLSVEDGLFYASVVCWYGMVICCFLLLYLGGVGYHMDQLEKIHIARLTQTVLVVQAMYGLAMCTSKWSVLWMLKRIFAVRTFVVITWVVIFFQAAWVVMTVLIGLLVCRPIQKNWDPTVEGTCGNQIAAYTAVSVYNVIIDIVMCVMPLPMIYKLQLKAPYKLALFGIFGISIVTITFAVLRLMSFKTLDFTDFAYTVPEVILWTYAEVGVVILVACSPLLRPIFDRVFRRFISSARSKSLEPSHGSFNYLNSASQPKNKSAVRSGFRSVGDSEESLVELGKMHPQSHIESSASGSKAEKPGSSAYPERRGSKALPSGLNGIVVERQVTQTIQ